MRESILACISLLVLTLVPLEALGAVDLRNFGIEVVEKKTEGGLNLYEARDREGRRFSFSVKDEITEAQARSLQVIKDTIFSWKNLRLASLKVAFSENRAEVAVVPTSYACAGSSLTQFMPSGMQFYYTTFLEYDFRLRVKNLFVRIQGQFFTEDQFCEKLLSAVKDPSLYIQTHDPEYVINKISEAERQMERMSFELSDDVKNLTALRSDHQSLKEDYNALKDDYTALKENYVDLRGDYKVLKEEDYGALKEDYRRQKGDYGALKDDYMALKDDYGLLKEDYTSLKEEDYRAFKEDYGLLKEDYTSLKEDDYKAFKEDYRALKEEDYRAFKDDYGRLKEDYTVLKEDDYKAFKEDYGAFKDDYGLLKEDYTSLKEEDYRAFKEDYGRLKEDYTSLKEEDYKAFKEDYEALKSDYASLKEDYASLKGDYASLKEDYGALKDDYHAVKRDHERLVAEFNTLRYALLALQNRDLFGGVHPLTQGGIDRVLALKKENPNITPKEVAEILKREKVSMSGNGFKLSDEGEIALILSVYFSDFKK
jgi:chromosome segregation ATPase